MCGGAQCKMKMWGLLLKNIIKNFKMVIAKQLGKGGALLREAPFEKTACVGIPGSLAEWPVSLQFQLEAKIRDLHFQVIIT